ncbi:glycosyltransferase family 2 protein [Prolixibacteraceae bacterium JC049]|nr:glycosyltransferase family 2 protein [Prolixibacteraceae bacterium JC049]
MPTISAVIITYNEAANISRCLQSLTDIADETIIVDAFSQDDTVSISNKFDVNLFQRKWDDYSSAKNFGNQKATKDYILSIDADEALSSELRQSLLQLKTQPIQPEQVFQFNRRNFYCGKWIKHCGWYPDTKIRLWLNKTAHWEGIVHEKLNFSNPVKKVHLEGDLLHYTYNSVEHHKQKLQKYAKLGASKQKHSSIIKAIIHASFCFLRVYIFKLGILDGIYGFSIAKLSSYETFLKHSRTRL